MHTILSWGMGVESTAILVRWLLEPGTRPCVVDELLVLTAQTGDEYADTRVLCERYILPLLRAERIRFVEVALDDAGHYALSSAVKMGSLPPNFVRVATVQTGLAPKF